MSRKLTITLLSIALWGCAEGDTDPGEPSDTLAPRVTDASPGEGDDDVDPALDTITLTFSELMDTTSGSLVIDGEAVLGAPIWEGQALVVPVSGLIADRAYRVQLSGFVDKTGTSLDGKAYLNDGALDFTTAPNGADVTAPTVVDADPNEAQVDVAVDLDAVTVTFDEPMATTTTDAILSGGAADVPLVGTWDATGTTITFPLSATLEYGTSYRIALTSFSDLAGNVLDGVAYLEDGHLDFTTLDNPDQSPPIAVGSSPAESGFNIDPDPPLVITVTFNEDMDETVTAVPLAVGSASPTMVTGVWSDGDTLLTITITDFLVPGAVYHLDLTGLRDEAGNLLDATDPYLENGILTFAAASPNGEGCNGPLVMAQATQTGDSFTWNIPAGAVGNVNGAFACDKTGAGTDAVVRFTKTSGSLAQGGKLLRVSAVGGSDDINLEITSGSCNPALGVVESCLWFKQSWDKILDVPAGTYWIWVSDDDTSGGFPGATITVEEVAATDASIEGEGCFAPYTTLSTVYTPPATASDFHTWTIPASINSFDIAPSSGSVGSISCDDHPTYGDVHGVDAVVQYDKQSPDSVLLVEVHNLDGTPTQSDLDVELLTACDTVAPTTESLFCKADADDFAFTASVAAGPVFLWVATEATGEELNGAEVKIREFSPGLGETRATAEPLTSSGPITPTSTVGLDRPSCFPTTGNIHWYSYTTQGTLFGVKGDQIGALAVVDTGGTEIACSTDTVGVAVGKNVPVGTTLTIAVPSPTTIGSLAIIDGLYQGVEGNATSLNVTFPTSAATEYSMAVGASQVFMGSTTEIWSFDKAGNTTAVEHDSAQGLTSTHLGYSIAVAGGRLFSVDSGTSTTASRLFAVHDEALSSWGPTAWDTPVSYPASAPVYAMTTDGTSLIMASRETTATEPLVFVSVPVAGPATPTVLGSHVGVYYVTGLAADASYFYVVGRQTTTDEFLYRFDRSNLAAAPLRLARVDLNLTRTNVVVDDLASADHVYVRDDSNVVHVVADPGGQPIDLGGLLTIGGTADYAMAIDGPSNTLYLFDSTLASNGGVVAIQ